MVCLSIAMGLGLVSAAPVTTADGRQYTSNVPDSSYGNGYAKECEFADGDTWVGQHGTGCFQPYGEIVWVKDEDANNTPVVVDWDYFGLDNSYRDGMIIDMVGAADGWTTENKSFDEGTFNFRVSEWSTTRKAVISGTCGAWQQATT